MATTDPRFICVSDLESYFVDNATGLPLSGGILTFYSDINRTELKPVYQLTGTPGNYSYEPLNNPCTLSMSGTFQDALGNNIVAYYYPYTGTPEDNTGIQELYYVTCVNSGFVPQFVRQGWPPSAGITPTPANDDLIDNLIPNGQFLAHNDWVSNDQPPPVSITLTTGSGSVITNQQPIAQGGWNLVFDQGSTVTFDNSFSTIPPSGGWSANNFPRYVFNFVCTGLGVTPPVYRDLQIQFPDVNKLSGGNPPGSVPYSLYFDAKSNDGNAYTFGLYAIYYYGTGGITNNYIETFIGNITIGPNSILSPINISIDPTFAANQSSIGTNNDDFVGLALRGPNSSWNVSVSDFCLVQGNETFTSFPIETNDEMLSRGVAGWMPTPDPSGADLYLPLILTAQGMKFDNSVVGQIVAKTQINPVDNELFMDGSVYVASDYSPLGIPYTRLRDYLMLNCHAISVTNGSTTSTLPAGYCPMFGTGSTFVTVFVNATAGKFDLSFNTASGSNAVNDQTSGFTHTSADPLYIFTVPGVPTASTYFSFTVATGGTKTYNVWFSVDGIGTAPATPTGANIEVALTSTDTIASTILAIAAAVNGYQFVVLDLRGYFLRGLDTTGTIDPNAGTRTLPGIADNTHVWPGAHLGSLEADDFEEHTHPPLSPAGQFIVTGGTDGGSSGAWTGANTTGPTGGDETRPVNIAVNYFIKY